MAAERLKSDDPLARLNAELQETNGLIHEKRMMLRGIRESGEPDPDEQLWSRLVIRGAHHRVHQIHRELDLARSQVQQTYIKPWV